MNPNQLMYRNGQPNYNYPQYGQYGQGMPRMDLKVIMCCDKCEEKVKEEIEELDGIENVYTDQKRSLVVVHGYTDAVEVVRKAKKVNRRAELQSVTSAPMTSAYDAVMDRPGGQYYRHDAYIAPARSGGGGGSYGPGHNRYEPDMSLHRDNYRTSYMDNRHYWPGGNYETTREFVRPGSSYYRPPNAAYYRPSQDYPSPYDLDPMISGYYDSGMVTNPNYLQPIRY